MKASIISSIIIALMLIVGAYFLTRAPSQTANNQAGSSASSAVTTDAGKQVINITANRGYYPRSVTAKAGVPTTLKMAAKTLYDCSSYVSIPVLGYQGGLSTDKPTEIEIPAQRSGSVIRGTCAMGMYSFSISFQ